MPRGGAQWVQCPRCGYAGYLVRRRVKGKYYFYVRHQEGGRYYEHCVGSEDSPPEFGLQVARAGEWRPPAKVVRYYGGDSPILPFLRQLVPQHTVYVEVFGGGASLLLAKPESLVEVYNDLNSRIVNLYMCIAKYGCLKELVELIKTTPISRVLWEEAKRRERETVSRGVMPSAEEAFYTLYARYWAYGGTLRGFNATDLWGGKAPHAWQWETLPKLLANLHRRLRRVVFENADWRYILRRYDRQETFFYLDPPHHSIRGVEEYLGPGVPKWTKDDFVELLNALEKTKGLWLLKYTWNSEVETEVDSRWFNYVVVEYRSAFKSREGHRYIFAMNYPVGHIEPAGYVRRVEKTVMRQHYSHNRSPNM